jgi:hypothetical protein
MNTQFALAVSKSFLDAYTLCVQGAEDVSDGKPALIPAVVCAAFSVEVGLKVILGVEGKSSTRHELRSLFQQISEESQDAIVHNTSYDAARFESDLSAASDAFTKWRYIYEEEGSRRVSAQFLMLLAHAIHTVAASLLRGNTSEEQQ